MFSRTYGRIRIEPQNKKKYTSRISKKKNNDYRVSKKEKLLLQLSDKWKKNTIVTIVYNELPIKTFSFLFITANNFCTPFSFTIVY